MCRRLIGQFMIGAGKMIVVAGMILTWIGLICIFTSLFV